jgi:hypothetical protein
MDQYRIAGKFAKRSLEDVHKRINIQFTLLEYDRIKQAARIGYLRPGTYCRKAILEHLGPIENTISGFNQTDLFNKRRTKKAGKK